jgi:site-specific DNA-methyltransferase (adenine-specific)
MDLGFHNINGLEMLKQIDSKSVDLVLTDPPYIISKKTGMDALFNADDATKDKAKYGSKYAIQTDYGEWDSNFTLETLEEFIKEFSRVLKNGGSCIIFFDLWKIETLSKLLEKHKFGKLRFIEWVKTNPVPINSKATYLSNAREIAISCVKGGKATFNSQYDNGIYEYPIYQGKREIDRIHPTQKSLELFEDLIKKHTNEGDVVVDPFGGSGTTYIACQHLNRKCYSSEISNDYYAKCQTRIKWHEDNKTAKTVEFFDATA